MIIKIGCFVVVITGILDLKLRIQLIAQTIILIIIHKRNTHKPI
jgi:hypothetical protein